ncbi:MAG: HAD family hydrolase [Chloroflexota bacterium]|nr:HAD family hydrolase [Chloroflexota bacterium]
MFDKDGTLIDFHAMWSGWAEQLAAGLEAATGRSLRRPLFTMLGYDDRTGRAHAGGALIATPMGRLRDLTMTLLLGEGLDRISAQAALDTAWNAPDPVALAHPLTDLGRLLREIRASGRRSAIVTSDDREPTDRTLAALGLTELVEVVVCADDGIATKPAPDAVLYVCTTLGVAPERAAVVGDSPADLEMGRSAGAGLTIGVRTGVGAAGDLASADVTLDSVADLRPLL